MLRIKRIYDEASPDDGIRILVDRIWPRGVSKTGASVDRWMKEISPSTELRKWFNHDPGRWAEFKRRYRKELEEEHAEPLAELAALAGQKPVTLLYSAKDREHNQAQALREFLQSQNS